MHLSKKNGRIIAESFDGFKQLPDYLRFMVNIYSVLHMDEKNWLTKTQKRFFISTLIHVLDGIINPINTEAIQIYKKHFKKNVTKAEISDYVGKISSKNWIQYDIDAKEVTVPSFFSFLDPEKSVVDFNLRAYYEKAN